MRTSASVLVVTKPLVAFSSCDLETKLSFYYPIRIAGCSLVLLKSFRTGSLETSRDDLVSFLQSSSQCGLDRKG